MDWKECQNKNIVKEANKDENLITSLKDIALNKLEVQDSIQLNEKSASVKVTLIYDAIRELLEALAVKNNFKVYNHECYCAFLKEVLQKSNLGDEFDSYRKIRNSINYYGKSISVEEAKDLIESMLQFVERVKDLL
jgi:hypothetical protein